MSNNNDQDKALEGEVVMEGNPMDNMPQNKQPGIDISQFIKPGDIEAGKTVLTPEQMKLLKEQMKGQ
jgi:hypothetical protein